MPASPRIRKAVGIDLGTTNSVIALLDATDSTLLTGRDSAGHRTLPSVVTHTDAGLVTGRPAAEVADPTRAVRSVKRAMGLDQAFALGPRSLSAAEVSAQILRALRDNLARALDDPRHLLDAAIITMPAYFNHGQIEATRQAGELAGFEVVELLHEPTAAAIYYSWAEGHGDATYLVYDLGGGTFDVSVIRKRYGDYEVLGVSGDPFLGGDDFDRLLASHLQTHGGPQTEFARLVRVAERLKMELSSAETAAHGGFTADRATFERLIRPKVERTVECCREALQRARDRAGITLSEIDHVVLVGGSSRIPLVRQAVRTAFCNPNLPERARSPEPLLHEPDLCVAYGAALRAAGYGTRYLLGGNREQAAGNRAEAPAPTAGESPSLFPVPCSLFPTLEVHITSPPNSRETAYQLTGVLRADGAAPPEGCSVRVEAPAAGLAAEAFLDEHGAFAQDIDLPPDADTALRLTVCDPTGAEVAALPLTVRHSSRQRRLGQAVLPTQLITRALQIEVLNRARQRVRQVVAPVGAPLPGVFTCTCRTVDQAGRIVVPILEDDRVVKQLVIDRLDPGLPVGTPVEVELHIDVKHTIRVKVAVPLAGRSETASIEAPPPPAAPTRADVEAARRQVESLLGDFSGAYRTRVKERLTRLAQDLDEALLYQDEPKAIQRIGELRGLAAELEAARGQVLDPPWPQFQQLVKHCLIAATRVAERTGRDRAELLEQVHAQERYAERAHEERNPTLYRECFDNLERLAAYLEQLEREQLPGAAPPPRRPPSATDAVVAARQLGRDVEELRRRARRQGRDDLDMRLERIAGQAAALEARAETDLLGVHECLREAQRLATEAAKVDEELSGLRRRADRDEGMLEGSI